MPTLNILLAVDDSEAALHACRLLAGYAGDRRDLRVTLLNVQRPPLRMSSGAGVHQGVLDAALREQGQRQLEPALALLQASGLQPEVVVRIGPPAETVLDVARESAAGLLLMGSGRQGLLGGYAVGSVALRAAPAADCPVVLVKPGVRLPAEAGIRMRVVASVDGSPQAQRAVQRLAECAGLLGRMHVDLVHFGPGLTLAAAVLPPHDDVLQQWSAQESDTALAGAAQVLADAGISHDGHRLSGAPETGISAFASRQGAELVVLGTRGMGTMHHLLLGSVALKTAQAAEVPVALLR